MIPELQTLWSGVGALGADQPGRVSVRHAAGLDVKIATTWNAMKVSCVRESHLSRFQFASKGNEGVTPCVVSGGARHGGGGRTTLPCPVESVRDRLTPAAEVSVKVTFSVARWKRKFKVF